MYCKKCGGKVESYASHCAFCGAPVESYDGESHKVNRERSGDYNYMTVWKWIGFYCLPLIPVVGSIIQIVLLFKWAFGSSSDPTLKSFCKAELLAYLVIFIICILAIALGGESLLNDLGNQLSMSDL